MKRFICRDDETTEYWDDEMNRCPECGTRASGDEAECQEPECIAFREQEKQNKENEHVI